MRLLTPRTASKPLDTKVADSLETMKLKAQAIERETQARQAQAKIKKFDAAYEAFTALIKLYEAIQEKRESISEEFYQFIRENDAKKATLLSELKQIEQAKARAMIPLDTLKGELDRREQELSARQQEVTQREEKVEVQEQENQTLTLSLLKREQNLNGRVDTVAHTERDTAKRKVELHQREEAFTKKVEVWQRQADQKGAQLVALQSELIQRDHALKVLQKENEKEKENIKNDRKKLLDQRATLQSAWNELKQKQRNVGRQTR